MSSDVKEEQGSSTSSGSEVVLWADSLAKTYDGQKYQFKEATFVLSRGERVGLIGVNGVGKSTLLKILSSKEPADGGTVTVRKGALLSYVEQDPLVGSSMTVSQALYSGDAPAMVALREYEEATAELASKGDEQAQVQLRAQRSTPVSASRTPHQDPPMAPSILGHALSTA